MQPEVKKAICTICDPQTQCGLDVHVQDGKVVRVEGDADHPFNRGSLCAKGAATRQYLYSEDRIRTPLRRVGPRGSDAFEPISWEEAMDAIARQCLAAKAAHGPESVVFYCGYPKYPRPFLRRLAYAFGSPNFATESSTCSSATQMAQRLVYGAPAAPDIAHTDCLLVWSSNPFYTNLGTAKALSAGLARGMQVIVVDPRITPTTDRAHLHLRPRPGTDGALALAMAGVMVRENLYDKEMVEKYTHGFEAYRRYVDAFTPEAGERLTGVPAGDIVRAARMFAGAKSAAIMPSASPVVHHTNGVQNYRAIFMLSPLTGNFDAPGGNTIRPPSYLYTATGVPSREAEFEHCRPMGDMAPAVGAERFPVWAKAGGGEAQAMDIPRQLREGTPYPLKGLVAFGMNHRMWPDSGGVRQSLEALDFFVNTDLFMTDTCRLADIVLPACTSLERSELRYRPDGRVILTQPVVPPLHQSRPDADIILDLANRLCPGDALMGQGYKACLDWIIQPSGVTMAQLEDCPEGVKAPNTAPLVLHKYEKGLATPSGKVEFSSGVLEAYGHIPGMEALPVYHPPGLSREAAPQVAEEYPFVLNTGSRLPMFLHSRMYRFSWLTSLRPNHPAADLHPKDAEKLGVAQDDDILIATPSGQVRVKANLTLAAQRGVVHMYHGSAKADVNTLLPGDYLDPISGFPGFKSALCRVERATEEVRHAD